MSGVQPAQPPPIPAEPFKMNNSHVTALLIEDNPDDALLMQSELAATGAVPLDLEWVERLSTGLKRLEQGGIDVVLLDLSLPDSSGAETLRRVLAQVSGVPIVVLTGLDDELLAFELVKEGAQDYLIKGQVDGNLLLRSVLYAIERHRLLAELREAKESAEARLRAVVVNTPVIMFALDRDGVFTLSEGKGLEALGSAPGEMVGKSIFDVYRDIPQILKNVRAALSGEARSLIAGVSGVTLEARYEPLRDQNGVVIGVVGVAHDITERKRLEEQFLQSQKMEAIGQLAGGIAHDFNNLLTAILGYCQLGMMKVPPEDGINGYLREIHRAAERASHLTRQLLAFSRRQIIEPRLINLNDLILNMDKMLRRLISENIELVALPALDLGLVRIDPGQVEQIVINLAVNARDAMPEGGTLTIETSSVVLDEEYARVNPEVIPGGYCMLAVTDSGIGMTEEIKAHVFEPFFTTKEVGKGSGLGLSTCYGIVAQNNGHITFDSEPTKGTTFRIYLPLLEGPATAMATSDRHDHLPEGTETVLLVEDEPSVRDVASHVLREQGYTVLEAGNGNEALNMVQAHSHGQIHLLLTDVVMPLMGGRELAGQIREIHPETAVLYTSGYTDDAIIRHGVLEADTEFIEKPFTPTDLARKVRELLDQRYRLPLTITG